MPDRFLPKWANPQERDQVHQALKALFDRHVSERLRLEDSHRALEILLQQQFEIGGEKRHLQIDEHTRSSLRQLLFTHHRIANVDNVAERYARVTEMRRPSNRPSHHAAFLMDLLLNKADREAIPGDLEEEFYARMLPKYGPTKARFWYWWQAVDAVALRNPLCRWAMLLLAARLGWLWVKKGG